MPRNLRDDFRMYYSGTFVTRVEAGVRYVMLVEDVRGLGDADSTSSIELQGPVGFLTEAGAIRHVNERNWERWRANTIEPFHPESGYYQLGGNGTAVYVEFQVQNRTNRKGFESNRALVNGRPTNLTFENVVRIFTNRDFPGKLFADVILQRSRVLWRGLDVGSFHDGVLALGEEHRFLQDFLEKYTSQMMQRGVSSA